MSMSGTVDSDDSHGPAQLTEGPLQVFKYFIYLARPCFSFEPCVPPDSRTPLYVQFITMIMFSIKIRTLICGGVVVHSPRVHCWTTGTKAKDSQ
jgi:hypothetical protein